MHARRLLSYLRAALNPVAAGRNLFFAYNADLTRNAQVCGHVRVCGHAAWCRGTKHAGRGCVCV
jgi:hypothetical protein